MSNPYKAIILFVLAIILISFLHLLNKGTEIKVDQ